MKIQTSRTYPHPRAKVWHALTDPEALSHWLMPTNFKLEKGHHFTFSTRPRGNFDGIVHCTLLDYRTPEMLIYTWQGGNMKMATTVHWKLTEFSGGTKVELVHSGFEGINGWLVSMLLGFGWKRTLLRKKLTAYLDEKT